MYTQVNKDFGGFLAQTLGFDEFSLILFLLRHHWEEARGSRLCVSF